MRVLKKNYQAITRNKLIAEAFYLGGDIEKQGSSIGSTIHYSKGACLPTPTFENYSGGFFVTVYTPDSNKFTEKVGKKVRERLTENQGLIISCLKENNYLSAKKIALKISVSPRKVEENLENSRIKDS